MEEALASLLKKGKRRSASPNRTFNMGFTTSPRLDSPEYVWLRTSENRGQEDDLKRCQKI